MKNHSVQNPLLDPRCPRCNDDFNVTGTIEQSNPGLVRKLVKKQDNTVKIGISVVETLQYTGFCTNPECLYNGTVLVSQKIVQKEI